MLFILWCVIKMAAMYIRHADIGSLTNYIPAHHCNYWNSSECISPNNFFCAKWKCMQIHPFSSASCKCVLVQTKRILVSVTNFKYELSIVKFMTGHKHTSFIFFFAKTICYVYLSLLFISFSFSNFPRSCVFSVRGVSRSIKSFGTMLVA